MTKPILEVDHLRLARGDNLIIENLSLSINEGDLIQVQGKNGTGKSSLLRGLSGLLPFDSGYLRWNGGEVSSPYEYTDEILFVGHKNGVREHLTVAENISWVLSLAGKGQIAEHRLLDCLERIDLLRQCNMVCAHLSAGQKRRLGLAKLFFLDARIWILDEPFNAIDVDGVTVFCEQIENHLKHSGAVMYSTHQQIRFPSRVPRLLQLESPMPGGVTDV